LSSNQLPTAVQPPGWVRPSGYSNGMLAEGRMVFVAGQVGWDPTISTPTFAPTFAAQFAQALGNVIAVLKAAGAGPQQVVRFTVYVTDKREYLIALKEVGEAWRKQMGKHFPAMTLVQVSALIDPQAKIEIEAEAILP
jgi:enamine deaminase RidA (YjgF/YER057c/UK114 family)